MQRPVLSDMEGVDARRKAGHDAAENRAHYVKDNT